MAFTLDLRTFIDKAMGNADIVVRKVAIDMLAKTVDRSPVGNPTLWDSPPPPGYVGGRFRGNWQVSFDAPTITEISRIDAAGSATLSAGQAVIQAYHSTVGSIWLMNNVAYAQRLEYGHSSQAPAGVVRVTVAEFQMFVNRAAQELSR